MLTAAGKFPRKIFVLDFIDLRRTQRKTLRSFQEFCCFITCILNDCKKASRNFKINLSDNSRFFQPRALSGNSPLHFFILIFFKKALGEVIALGAGCFNQMSYLEILRRIKYAGISQINLVYKRKHRKQYYWIKEECRLYFMFKTKCRTNSQILKSLLKNRRKML